MNKLEWIIIVFVGFILMLVLWILLNYIDHSLTSKVEGAGVCPKNTICLHPTEYQHLVRRHHPVIPTNYTRERDMKVLQDPLFPAYNRTDKKSYEGIVDYTMKHHFNVPTQMSEDSYRLIGYLVNDTDTTSQKWKLFGKMKDRNRGDFYMMPVDKTQDMKIQIQDSMVVGEKMKSLDTVPNEITFNTPLLSDTPYKYIELPKGDFTDEYL